MRGTMGRDETVLQRIQRERAERMAIEAEARRAAAEKKFDKEFILMALLGTSMMIGLLIMYVFMTGL